MLPLLLALACARPPVPADPVAPVGAPDPLSSTALLATITELASPRYEGRMSGGAGYRAAAEAMAARFERAGLVPALPEGWFQTLPVEVNHLDTCLLELPDAPGAPPLVQGRDWACRGLSAVGDVTAPVVFAGYGLSLPDHGWDDYAGLDVRGKVVLALKQPPPWPLEGVDLQGASLPRPKAIAARDHGAVALLLVSRQTDAGPQPPIGSLLEGDGVRPEGFPVLQVDLPVANTILGSPDLAALQAAADLEKRPGGHPTQSRVHVRVEGRYDPNGQTENVLAVLPGADPALRDTWVIVGAHLDHVGRQGPVIYPGANDNASGSAVVVHLAEALAASPTPPARSVLFVLFASEEHRMDGSRWLAGHLPMPADRVVAMLNLDCIADGTALQLGGGEASPVLWNLAREAASAQGIQTAPDTWYGGGADAQAFFDAGIPTLYFAGLHGYSKLHLPGDTPDTLSAALLQDTARVAWETLRLVASGGYAREPRQPEPVRGGGG